MDNDTIVFIFGDHGMTPTGDHGGETALETDAALLIYTPRPLFDPNQVCHILTENFSVIIPYYGRISLVPRPPGYEAMVGCTNM